MAEYRGTNQEGDRRVIIHTADDDGTLSPDHIYITTRDNRGTESLRVRLTPSLALQIAIELVSLAEVQMRKDA